VQLNQLDTCVNSNVFGNYNKKIQLNYIDIKNKNEDD